MGFLNFRIYWIFVWDRSPSDLCMMTLFKRDCGMVRGGFQEKTVFSLNFSFEGNNKKWSGPLLTLCPDIKNYFCLLWSIQQKIAENNIGGKFKTFLGHLMSRIKTFTENWVNKQTWLFWYWSHSWLSSYFFSGIKLFYFSR